MTVTSVATDGSSTVLTRAGWGGYWNAYGIQIRFQSTDSLATTTLVSVRGSSAIFVYLARSADTRSQPRLLVLPAHQQAHNLRHINPLPVSVQVRRLALE